MSQLANILASISRMKSSGTLSDTNINKTIFYWVDFELGISDLSATDYETRQKRVKLFANYADQVRSEYQNPPDTA